LTYVVVGNRIPGMEWCVRSPLAGLRRDAIRISVLEDPCVSCDICKY
jgi:hypothetical protein